jgi:hypothetical protein
MLAKEGQLDRQNRPASNLGIHLTRSAQARCSFLDAKQSETFYLPGIEALAVVLDTQSQPTALLMDAYPHHVGVGVAFAIVERFLDDPVKARLELLGKILRCQLGCNAYIH